MYSSFHSFDFSSYKSLSQEKKKLLAEIENNNISEQKPEKKNSETKNKAEDKSKKKDGKKPKSQTKNRSLKSKIKKRILRNLTNLSSNQKKM